MALKRGDAMPNEVKPEAKELADAFLRNWCREAFQKRQIKAAAIQAEDTVGGCPEFCVNGI